MIGHDGWIRGPDPIPAMRNELMVDLRALHASGTATPIDLRRIESDLDDLIHFLYDDTCLASDASDAVGWFLRSEEEAGRIREITTALDLFFATFGMHLNEERVVTHWRWQDAMAAISRFLDAHWEEPYDFDRESEVPA